MILHKMNGASFEINPRSIRDVQCSHSAGCAILTFSHDRIFVREAVGQVKRIMQWEREGLQPKLDL